MPTLALMTSVMKSRLGNDIPCFGVGYLVGVCIWLVCGVFGWWSSGVIWMVSELAADNLNHSKTLILNNPPGALGSPHGVQE